MTADRLPLATSVELVPESRNLRTTPALPVAVTPRHSGRVAVKFTGALLAVCAAAGLSGLVASCDWGQPAPYCRFYAQAGPSGTTIQHVCGSGHQGGPRQYL